jgi:hypothetical protein
MRYFLKNLLFPQPSAFVVTSLGHARQLVVAEDTQLGLQIEVPKSDQARKGSQNGRALPLYCCAITISALLKTILA